MNDYLQYVYDWKFLNNLIPYNVNSVYILLVSPTKYRYTMIKGFAGSIYWQDI